jgi:anti-sigma B factor antagonist
MPSPTRPCHGAVSGTPVVWLQARTESEPRCRGLLREMGDPVTTRKDGPLAVDLEHAGDVLMVRASGELSRSTAERFEVELGQGIDRYPPTIVLDLSGVGFIDSTGLRSVLRIANHSRRKGGRLRIRNPSAQVQEAIDWGGMGRLVPLGD